MLAVRCRRDAPRRTGPWRGKARGAHQLATLCTPSGASLQLTDRLGEGLKRAEVAALHLPARSVSNAP